MWFILKVLILIVLAVIVRGTLPRYRIDQLISYLWKYIILIYIFFILELSVLFIYFSY